MVAGCMSKDQMRYRRDEMDMFIHAGSPFWGNRGQVMMLHRWRLDRPSHPWIPEMCCDEWCPWRTSKVWHGCCLTILSKSCVLSGAKHFEAKWQICRSIASSHLSLIDQIPKGKRQHHVLSNSCSLDSKRCEIYKPAVDVFAVQHVVAIDLEDFCQSGWFTSRPNNRPEQTPLEESFGLLEDVEVTQKEAEIW